MKPLTPPDTHHLRAALGWIELGNHVEANEELEQIAPGFSAHPDVLELRWQIYARTKNWTACVDIATALVTAAPDQPFGWLHRSYALHELERTREAADLLEPAAKLFPGGWLIRYNLACYAARLGNRKAAWTWLENAFDLADDPKAVKLMALNDPDLETFWTEIGEV